MGKILKIALLSFAVTVLLGIVLLFIGMRAAGIRLSRLTGPPADACQTDTDCPPDHLCRSFIWYATPNVEGGRLYTSCVPNY